MSAVPVSGCSLSCDFLLTPMSENIAVKVRDVIRCTLRYLGIVSSTYVMTGVA